MPTTYVGIPASLCSWPEVLARLSSRQFCEFVAHQFMPFGVQPPRPSTLRMHVSTLHMICWLQFGPPSVASTTYVFFAPANFFVSSRIVSAVGVPPLGGGAVT